MTNGKRDFWLSMTLLVATLVVGSMRLDRRQPPPPPVVDYRWQPPFGEPPRIVFPPVADQQEAE